jgi:hypothetical protein
LGRRNPHPKAEGGVVIPTQKQKRENQDSARILHQNQCEASCEEVSESASTAIIMEEMIEEESQGRPKRKTRCEHPITDMEPQAATRPCTRQPRAKLFSTEPLAPQPAAALGLAAEALLVGAVHQGLGASEPAAAACAYGPKGKELELYHDDEGRPYRVGELVWLILCEATPEGTKAEKEAKKAAEAADQEQTANKEIGTTIVLKNQKARFSLAPCALTCHNSLTMDRADHMATYCVMSPLLTLTVWLREDLD